jgi:hypothetical protein
MHLNLSKEVAAWQRLTVKDLRTKYAEVFGEEAATNHKGWLVKRLAWRLQALAEGDLGARARRRAAELANDADLRLSPPRRHPTNSGKPSTTISAPCDRRLPPPGAIITRTYKGATLHVKVLSHGFQFQGEAYPSLSALARAITGSHCNGFLFFRLNRQGGRP